MRVLTTPGGTRFGLFGQKPTSPAPTLFVFAAGVDDMEKQPIYTETGRHLAKQGWLYVAEGRYEVALDAFRTGERIQTLLVAPQRISFPVRSFVVQMLVRLGDTEAARSALAEMDDDERDRGERRAALASLPTIVTRMRAPSEVSVGSAS